MSGGHDSDRTARDRATAHRLVSILRGTPLLDAFADDSVTEIYTNPDGKVFYKRQGVGREKQSWLLEADRAQRFLNAVAHSVGVELAGKTQRFKAELPEDTFGGARLQGFAGRVVKSPAFVIRKHARLTRSLQEYVAAGQLGAGHYGAIVDGIHRRRNFLICGPTASGKTTFARAVLKEMADLYPQDRFIFLEDTQELSVDAEDVLPLRTVEEDGVHLVDLVMDTLRSDPTRVVVGEVRDSAVFRLLDVLTTGHPGGLATFHAETPDGALDRVNRLAMDAGVPSQLPLIAEAIHYLIMLQGGESATRGIRAMVRVDGLSKETGWFILTSLPREAEQNGDA